MADTNKDVARLDTFPWHRGEVTLQRHAGVADFMAGLGRRVVRDHMPEQHRAFFHQLPHMVAGVVDELGQAWATVLCGDPGFVFSEDSTSLRIGALPYAGDPAKRGLTAGAAIGLLGIDLTNRRRNRANGVIRHVGTASFDMDVIQSFGNCPQYIRNREPEFIRDHREPPDAPAQELSIADPRVRNLIDHAETLFIVSYCDEGGHRQVDVSHKGGKPGFVKIDEDGRLLMPDFAGNRFFNTLGNILLTPQCGLMFIDFANGDVLQITGEGLVVLDATQFAGFDGAERLLRVDVKRLVFRPAALALRWISHKFGASPSVEATGTWAEAELRERANRLGNTWRPFGVARMVDESCELRSFFLTPLDETGLAEFRAGQHLPVRIKQRGRGEYYLRHFWLSSAPSDGVYRINVKRDGKMATLLHSTKDLESLEVGEPAGGFMIDAADSRPAVFIAEGIGVSPFISMLRHVVHEGLLGDRMRAVWLVYGARSTSERAFDEELASLVVAGRGRIRVTRVLADITDASENEYELSGEVDVELLRMVLPFSGFGLDGGHDFYLSGPDEFVARRREDLLAMSVPIDYIHTEVHIGTAATRPTEKYEERCQKNKI